ncbi:hypothetical protein ACS0TY_009109 [Phlomoides rotata]
MIGSPHNLTLKFLCSYGGRILPRYPDGKLRYHGGETRVLSVHRSISFSELVVKLGEMCGITAVNLRCQLPLEDLDALVSITSDEDLANLIEEYDRVAAAAPPPSSVKIRAFLSAPKKSPPPPPSTTPSSASSSSNDSTTSPKSPFSSSLPPKCPTPGGRQCVRHSSRPPLYPIIGEKGAGKLPNSYVYQYHHSNGHGNGSHVYVIHNGNHWQ